MSIVSSFIENAKAMNRSVVLPEGNDERIIAAARQITDQGIADVIVLGKPDDIDEAAKKAGVTLDGITIINPAESDTFEQYAEQYAKTRDLNIKIARRMVKRPLFFGGMMVATGDADTMVAGVANATATVIQSGALTIGYAQGIETASSFFLMIVPEFQGQTNKPFIFADCAVNIAPTPSELADIAIASEASGAKLLGEKASVAMLICLLYDFA